MKKYLILLLLLIPSLSWGALVPAIEVHSVDYDGDDTTTTVEIGEEVYFSATGTTYDDTILLGKARYEWDWGDGYDYDYNSGYLNEPNYNIYASGIAATHYFMSTGTKTVTLSVKIYDTYPLSNYAPTITTTSTSSNTIGTGDKTFTVSSLTRVLEYNTGTHAPTVGQTLYQEDSGAEIVITRVQPSIKNTLGDWDGDGVGWLYFTVTSGTLVTGKHLHEAVTGAGQLVCNVVVAGHNIEVGAHAKALNAASTAQGIQGVVKSFNTETGELVIAADYSAGTGTITSWLVTVDALPVASETTTTQITVSGTAPLAGFEIQHAPYEHRSKQYLYIQIPPAHRNTTTQLKVSLIGATTGTTVLLAPKDNLGIEEIVPFDQSSLAADTYTVQAQLLDADDNQITGGIWKDKYIRASATPVLTIDENNSFKINGEFYFPMTPFLLGESNLPSYISEGGVNGTFMYYDDIINSDTWGTFLDDVATYHLYAIGPGAHTCDQTYIPSGGNYWKMNHDPDCMVDYVTANKSKPYMFGWNWQDEVNLGGDSEKVYPPTVAAWAYAARHKAGDYAHFSHQGFVGSDWSRYYGTGIRRYDYLTSDMWFGGKKWVQDFLGYDTYPVTQQLYPIQNCVRQYCATTGQSVLDLKMGTYAVAMESIDRFISNNKNLVPFMPASQPCKGATPLYVTSNQIYMESWLNIIHGAKGIVWFNYFNFPVYGRFDAMKRFSDSITADRGSGTRLLDVFLGAPSTRTITDTANPTNTHHVDYAQNRVDTMIREYGGYIYVFAARLTEPEPANSYLTVRLTGTPGTVVSNGTISDTADAHVWALPESVTIGNDGTASVIATCVDEGYITAAYNTLTKIVSGGSAGWTAVTNVQSATPGCAYYDYTEPATLEDVQFTISGLSGEATVEVLDESRSLTATEGVFTDDFVKDAVHLYRISSGTPTTYTVTVTKAGAGTGTVTSSISGINCGSDCTEAYVTGNTIVFTATPDTASAFDGWSGTYGCSGTSTCTVSAIAANAAVTATFSVKETPPVYHNMIVSYTGDGSGVTSPAAGEISEGEGTEVVITATANENNSFNAWGGTCGCSGSTSPCTISSFPTSDCTVTAEFTKDPEYYIDVNMSPGVTSVSSDTGVTCPYGSACHVVAEPDSTVIFTVTPDQGYYNCVFSGCTGATGSCEMTENKTLSVSCTFGTGVETSGLGSITIGSGGTATLGRSAPLTGSNMGTDNTDGVLSSLVANRADCWSVQAPISGTLTTAYVAHGNTSEATAKVCVYTNDGDSPDAGDLKLGCSGAITSSAVEWKSSNMDGGSVVSGLNYYMCLFIDDNSANAFSVDKSSINTTLYYKTNTGFYDTPGDTLYNASTGWSNASTTTRSVYVSVTP